MFCGPRAWEAFRHFGKLCIINLSLWLANYQKQCPTSWKIHQIIPLLWCEVFSITNELSIKLKTTLTSLSNLEYTFLCEQAARIHSFFFFFLFSPFFIQRSGEGKKKKTQHNSQCSNKGCVLMIFDILLILRNHYHIDKENLWLEDMLKTHT